MLKINGFSTGIAIGAALGVTGGIAAGAILGFIGGIFLAPKSGSDLRNELMSESQNLYNKANDTLNESLDEFKSKGNQAISKVRAAKDDLIKVATERMPEQQT